MEVKIGYIIYFQYYQFYIFSNLTSIAKSKKQRTTQNLLFLEGQFLIEEALKSGVTITDIFFSKIEHLEFLPLNQINIGLSEKIKFYKTNYNYMKLWSDVNIPSGIIGI